MAAIENDFGAEAEEFPEMMHGAPFDGATLRRKSAEARRCPC
jgi:hypothetical protein